MPIYLDKSHLEAIFAFVSLRYGRQEEVPVYAEHKEGMSKLLGILERTRMDVYYPSFLDKAVHLLVGINKGHCFGNGNKRLALVATSTFLTLNGKCLSNHPKSEYELLLEELFPMHKAWVDFPEFTGTDFATYNLSIIIADSGALGIDHDALKSKVLHFLKVSVAENRK